MPLPESYTILSVGCGTGFFEETFVKKLLSRNKTVHFVGIDTQKIACIKTQEWCHKLSISKPKNFSFTICTVGFEKFQSCQKFDIILLIHSLYYFSEIKTSVPKVYELIQEGGMAIIARAPKRNLITEIYAQVNEQLYGKSKYFSEDVEKVLTKCNRLFRKETIEFSVKITECFQKESEFGKRLLNFLVGANTAYFSPLQLQLFLDYFEMSSQKLEGGEIMLPHSGNLFYLEK
ncbi:MAG: class I SAM-dependent methyltransferase [Moorea sp. SIO2B7]|nr:class I SAM-dependent methyltransferase [Moorena sp. SIO2B7]